MRALLLPFLLCAGAASAAAPAPRSPRVIYRSDDLELIVKTQSLKAPRIATVVGLLELKPEMTVLDVGAGSGQLAYAAAAALKGTGKVYAADIDPKLVAYVATQARERGLKNLESMLVSPEGVDAAYAGRSYDLILMYDVANYLTERVEFYRGLRKLLKPGGRVVLVESESVPDRSFTAEDVKDWDGLVARLKAEPLDGPMGRLLRKPLENAAQRRDVLFHLNRVLDLKLYLHFTDGLAFHPDVAFTPEEKPYADWLLHRLTLDGVSERDLGRSELQLFRLMQMLNKLLVVSRYRDFLAFDGVHPYWSAGPEARWHLAHERRVEELASAGYRLERRVPLPPFQAVWSFKAAD